MFVTQGFNIQEEDVAYVAFLVVLSPLRPELEFNRCTYTLKQLRSFMQLHGCRKMQHKKNKNNNHTLINQMGCN